MDKLFVDDNALALYYASLEERVDALEEGGGSSLPDVTASDNGKVLTVSSGKWAAKAVPTELPSVTSSDNGKVLGVSGGKWTKQAAPTELPAVSASDNGKVLAVNNGAWAKQAAPAELPAVTATDNGNVLTVVEGQWQKAEPSGGGGGSVLLVEMVEDEEYGSRVNKTCGEIMNAFTSGTTVILKQDNSWGDNMSISYNALRYIDEQGTQESHSYNATFNGTSLVAFGDENSYLHYAD